MLDYTIEADGMRLTDNEGNHAGWIVREGPHRYTVAMDLPAYKPVTFRSLEAAKYRALSDFLEACHA